MNSCDSFVDVELPKSQLINTSVFKDNSTADAALTDIYSKIRDEGMLTGQSSGLSTQLGTYTDEITSYIPPASQNLAFYNNTLLPSTYEITNYWNTAYNQIFAANSVIEGVQESATISTENKKRLQGEALFIRALLHFYLVNLYGDIPYVKQTDYQQNKLVTRMIRTEVYKNIISDLQNSIDLLLPTYSSTERVRPNQYTAKALLSRAYLYSGAYAEAANMASELLNQTSTFLLGQNIDQVFLMNSKETIWQLKPTVAGNNTDEAGTFIILSVPPSNYSLTTELVNSFGANDLRKSRWIKAIGNSSSTWYHAYKYKEREFTPVSKEYSIVFRLAEQYLIRAEARAQNEDLEGAKQDLNKIRSRANLNDTPAATKSEILDAILQERNWEYFTEYGHRFFDLKRFNKIDNVLSALKPGWNSDDQLFPIPQTELNTNPNLRPQNPGY